jgi:hypothetical protein
MIEFWLQYALTNTHCFVVLSTMSRESTRDPLPAIETIQNDEGRVGSGKGKGRGKPLENSQRMAILQALSSQSRKLKILHGAPGLVAR